MRCRECILKLSDINKLNKLYRMNKIDFSRQGGFPLTQDTLDFMQSAYLDSFGAVAGLLGDKVIISGCTANGGIVSPGIVAVGGEILPTAGGAAQTVFINTEPQTAIFEDGEHKEVYFRKSLAFGVGNPSWEWSSFKRLSKIADMAAATVPAGAIIMWHGSEIPAGWAYCDGTQGTPDMRGRFGLCASSGYPLGNTGGSNVHTLTPLEMPYHSHQVTDPGHVHYLSFNSKNPSGSTGNQAPQELNASSTAYQVRSSKTGISIGYAGSGAAHNNMPPYRAVYYIMKL
jgi:microcystin-dependent protein